MRRAQTFKHYARPSMSSAADDLGVLREAGEETIEDVLRQQLLEKSKENEKLRSQIQSLQVQLQQRPPLEAVQELNKERTNLEILLDGTQRENAKTMAERDQAKARAKELETHLEKLAGPNWQENLGISAPPPLNALPGMASTFMRPRADSTPPVHSSSPTTNTGQASAANSEAAQARIEQIRMLIMGMEQRLQIREEKLAKNIEKAEVESARFEELRKQVLSATSLYNPDFTERATPHHMVRSQLQGGVDVIHGDIEKVERPDDYS
ncbi:hypothetical protein EIP91_005650 [Steccherinum ochraceum]|uniref:Uncharacterized protein n=1 Tax=Steccherinum ochraceum TaxID=92696 RepID=A0A4R0RFC4_9APHY|nr:hypothetical protein EIP91_005650 [Steccherinum ochraceum]